MKKVEINEELGKEIIRLYVEERLSPRKLEDIIGIGRNVTYRYLKEHGVIRKPGERRFTCLDEYFDNIDNEHKAYWLGVLFADGNVSKKEKESGVVRFNTKDKDWIEEFKKDIQFTGKIGKEIHKTYNKEIYTIYITSDKMYNSLCDLGCTPRKSLTIQFPDIPEEYIQHFIRGYFDGDGTVSINKNKSDKQYYTLRSGFCSGSLSFLESLRDKLPLCEQKIHKYNSNSNIYTLVYSVKDSIALYKYLYIGATIYLKRKKDKFEEYIKYRQNNEYKII